MPGMVRPDPGHPVQLLMTLGAAKRFSKVQPAAHGLQAMAWLPPVPRDLRGVLAAIITCHVSTLCVKDDGSFYCVL